MELIYRSSLIVILIETILHCVSGDITKIGLTEPTETTLIEMKPLYHYSFDDNDQGSRKLNRLLKKNRKKDPYGKRRDSFRLFTSDDDKQKESTKESESGSQQEAGVSGQGSSATGGGKVVNIDKGLLESHKEQELDHLDHDSHSNEDKFVKMIWDKGDGFVKRWHWDRGEKIKEKHSIAEKKHLEHHDKGKIDEHIEKQKGVVVHSKAEDLTETNGIDNMAKSTMTSDKETKNDDIVQQLRLLKQRQQEKGESENIDQQLNGQSNNYQELNGNDNNNNNEENVNDSANNSPNNRVVSMLLGGQSEDSENGENNNGNGLGNNDENNQENINNLRRKQYREILQRGNHVNRDDDDEDTPRLKNRRFPVKKAQQQLENNEDNQSTSSPGDSNDLNNIKKHLDYHRRVTVREEKSELASQERYQDGGNSDEGGKKDQGGDGGDASGNNYEAGSKGSGYIKSYQLTSDGQNNQLNPIDFASIVGDQSLQIKTAVASENDNNQPKTVNQDENNQIKSSERDIDTSLSRAQLITNNHFQSNTLQMINPR